MAQKFLKKAKTIALNQESSVEKLLGSSSFFLSPKVNDFYLRLIALICRINNYKDLNLVLQSYWDTISDDNIDDIIEFSKSLNTISQELIRLYFKW